TKFYSFTWWFLPWLGVSELQKTVVNFSATTEYTENHTTDVITALQKEVKSLSQVALQKQTALDLLLASQGEECIVINTSCSVYIDQCGRVSTDVQ
ncbi:ERVV2 protein, partial [Falcunculus frontatus]|nr:ERVV2 protein [Falcunculus frontatus]